MSFNLSLIKFYIFQTQSNHDITCQYTRIWYW